MRDIVRLMRQHKFLVIWPVIVLVVMLALAAWVVTRPILGNAVYRP